VVGTRGLLKQKNAAKKTTFARLEYSKRVRNFVFDLARLYFMFEGVVEN
jgi:hypothetical protein